MEKLGCCACRFNERRCWNRLALQNVGSQRTCTPSGQVFPARHKTSVLPCPGDKEAAFVYCSVTSRATHRGRLFKALPKHAQRSAINTKYGRLHLAGHLRLQNKSSSICYLYYGLARWRCVQVLGIAVVDVGVYAVVDVGVYA